MSDVSCEVSFVDYVLECVKNHDRLEQENKQLIETGHKANKALRNEVDRLEQENAELREALQVFVDGYSSHDLVHQAGLTQEECKKIIDIAMNK